jgi:hypothetical protein
VRETARFVRGTMLTLIRETLGLETADARRERTNEGLTMRLISRVIVGARRRAGCQAGCDQPSSLGDHGLEG